VVDNLSVLFHWQIFSFHLYYYYYYYTFNGLFSRTTWVSQNQKGKTTLDLNEARDDGVLMGPYGNILNLAPDRQPHQHPITHFYRPDALPDTQPTASKHL